jgi:hypothetical protein
MNSTLITSEDLKDLGADELQSKFFRMSRDVERMRSDCAALPLAEESLRNVQCELAKRRRRPAPKP